MSDTRQTLLEDQYNSVLVSNVRPSDWVNPEPARRYNLVIVGAGPAGLAAVHAAMGETTGARAGKSTGAQATGAKIALIEDHLLGGEGLITGCVPSKSLIRSARAHADVYTAGRYGVRVPETISGDFEAAMTRLRKTRSALSSHISARRLRDMGVDVFLGRGRFTSPDTVEVEGRTLRFARALIATGSRPVVPPIEGLSRVGYLTNETLFSLTRQPRRLAVIGAGPIGCEMAQAFCRLGSDVTLIEQEPQILPGEDPDACRILTNSLQRDEITVKLGAIVTHVRGSESEKTIHLRTSGASEQVTADEILVCVGRSPNVDGLALASAGIKRDAEHGIVIDDHLRTSNTRVYAAGDVCTRYRFAHVADAMARIAVHNALFFGRKRFSDLIIPRCIYTDPEISRVGIGCDEARARGWQLDTYSVPFHTVDRAVIDGDEEGLLKIHVRKGTDKIMGATIIGRQACDMISEITLAMVHNIGLKGISEVLYLYPTHIEAIRKAADACKQSSVRPTLRALLRRWLAWSR